ncbi:MAG: PAS domain S-box protein, partial [Opitutales bacterium]
MAIIGLFIALAAAAYISGWQVKRDSELVVKDAVPGTIAAHKMRMAMSRSIGWAMVAASAQTTQSRDASLKIAHDADAEFADDVTEYEATIVINPAKDQALLDEVTSGFAKFQQQRMTYEALILAGDRDKSAAFLEQDLVPAYVSAIASAGKLLDYNQTNSITYTDHIRNSVHRLYWAVAVVMVLALVCASVLIVNLSIRRREVRELRESEELFRTSFENATVGVCLVATDGRFLNVNRTLCAMLGYSEEELLQLTFNDVTHDEDKEIGRTFLDSVLSGGPKTMRTEKRYLRKDGQVVWAYLSTALIEKSRAHGDYMISHVQDITERKRATEQLEMLKVSIDKHFDGAYWLDANNRFVYVNDSACKALGYDREELLGQSVALIAPKVTPQNLEEVWKRLREAGFFTRESVHRRKDGSEYPVEIVATYVRFEGKEFNCGFARDITERQRAQAELVSKTALLEAQVDSTIDAILVVDEHGKRILHNQRFLDFFKIPEEIARDDNHDKMLQHAVGQMKNPKQFSERVAYLYAHPNEIGRDEIELADGRTLDRYSAPVDDKAGKHYGRIWTFRDITAQRKVEEQFRQAQKMEAIGTLAGGIAHDFNNILAAINGYTEMAKRRVTNDPVAKKYLDAVFQGGTRAVELVKQILAFSRPQELQQRTPVELSQIVAEPLKLLRASIPSTIEFDVSLASDLPAVLADATQVHQVVMNLCTNASHAMKDRAGRLGVRLEKFTVDKLLAGANAGLRAGPYVRLSVSDTGHGMSRATVERIFEPFFTTKGPGEGTGLGLSVVHGIMQSHGGAITVYSQPGEGTVFHLYFPVTADTSRGTAAMVEEPP